MKYLSLLFVLNLMACAPKIHMQRALTETEGISGSIGYEPLDPLPIVIKTANSQKETLDILNSFPDETMRLAIGQVQRTGGVTYGTGKVGYEGNSYIIVLDYIKFDTKSLNFIKKIDTSTVENHGKDSAQYLYKYKFDTVYVFTPDKFPDLVVPAYIGVGLRLTANITVTKGEVNLGNFLLIGAAASENRLSGTLVVQTLGISGKGISALLPMPSDINSSSVQNAIVALGSIKAKLYDEGTMIKPRVVGFYNTLGSSSKTSINVITAILSHPLTLLLSDGSYKLTN
jgi:hypothetical protein